MHSAHFRSICISEKDTLTWAVLFWNPAEDKIGVIWDLFNTHNQTWLFALVQEENRLQIGFYSLKYTLQGQNMPRLPKLPLTTVL